jgi:tetratricopeptide (TPR) repeat protein
MNDNPQNVVDLAKAAINQQDPHGAIRLLTSVERTVENMPGMPVWADHRIALAEAYGALGDEVAPSFFDEALDRLTKLAEQQPLLEVRANEHYADYLCRFAKRFSKARELLGSAKLKSAWIGKENTARIQMKITSVDLRVDNDPELENFTTFKRVARQLHATYQTQLAAWMQHLGQQERATGGLRAARNRNHASEQHFIDLIVSVQDAAA